MAQAHMVRNALLDAHGWPEEQVEIVPMIATGDRILDRALAEVGGKAVWTKELDGAILSGAIDFAVHSMKDVETIRPASLRLVSMLARADVRDRIVGAGSIDALAQGARVGTSAPRRRAQLLRARPDLEVVLLRGNVQTRLGKVASGEVDATLLASAGLARLGLDDTGAPIETETLLPAPAQGAVGIEAQTENSKVIAWLEAINHGETYACVMAERALLAELSGDCRSPVAALARMDGQQINLRAELYSPDGRHAQSGILSFSPGGEGPTRLAAQLLAQAHPEIAAVFGH
jgi:hydroxymethylbilane synthase